MQYLGEFVEDTEIVFADTSSPHTGYVRVASILYDTLALEIEQGCPVEFIESIKARHQELWGRVGQVLLSEDQKPIVHEDGELVVLGTALPRIV
jgi:hypothetical protein